MATALYLCFPLSHVSSPLLPPDLFEVFTEGSHRTLPFVLSFSLISAPLLTVCPYL